MPYCSSDMWLGESGDFHGRQIAKAAIETLLPEIEYYGVDEVVLVGGAGIMTQAGELKAMLPSRVNVSAVCDGCMLFSDLDGPTDPKDPTRSTDTETYLETGCDGTDPLLCPPETTLPTAVEFWNATDSLAKSVGSNVDCTGWLCLVDGNPIKAAKRTPLPLLAAQPLYDRAQFVAR